MLNFVLRNGDWKTRCSILLVRLEIGRRKSAQFCSEEWRLEDKVLNFACKIGDWKKKKHSILFRGMEIGGLFSLE